MSALFLLSGALFLSGCAGSDGTEETDDGLQQEIRRRAQVFEEARNSIAVGTPSTIEKGLDLLRSENLHTTERGAELAYAALAIRSLVYPYLDEGGYTVSLPATSIYGRIVEAVEAGTYPEVESDKTDFMTLLLSSLTVLTSSQAQEVARAQETVEQLAEVNPDSLLVSYLTGISRRKEGDEGEALEQFLRISEQDASCYPARLAAIELAERRGRPELVISYANQLLERFPKKLDVARAALKVLISLGRYERADTLLSAAIARFSEDWELLLLRAVLLEKMGDREKAMRLIRGFEREREETAETLLVRGRVAFDRTDYREAEQLARRGLAAYPGNHEFLILQSEVLVNTGRGEEAYALLQRRWREETWNMQLLYRLFELAVRLERWEDGEEYLDRLIEYSPGDFEVLRSAVRLFRGRGRIEAALAYAQELIELFPERPATINVYLDTLLNAGREQELRGYVDRRLESSDSSEVRSILYFYLSEVQDGTGAKIASLQSSLYENMQNTRALIRIAELYQQQGETAKAARYLRQAVASRPDDQELQDRLRRLEAQLD